MFATHKASLRVQTTWVRDWLRDFPGRLFVCSGNHDWWDSGSVVDNDAHEGWLSKMSRPAVTVDGQSAYCGGFYIHCHAFRAPLVWPHAPADRWILLHHVPPALAATGIGGTGGNDNGCRELAGALTTAARPPWSCCQGICTNRSLGAASAVRPGRSIPPATTRRTSRTTSLSIPTRDR